MAHSDHKSYKQNFNFAQFLNYPLNLFICNAYKSFSKTKCSHMTTNFRIGPIFMVLNKKLKFEKKNIYGLSCYKSNTPT